jgi:hypothetical protein
MRLHCPRLVFTGPADDLGVPEQSPLQQPELFAPLQMPIYTTIHSDVLGYEIEADCCNTSCADC